MTKSLLILWDIDGTLLLRASLEHAQALHEALHEVHGVPLAAVAGIAAAGRTDGAIAKDILLHHGVSETQIDERAEDVREAACRHYARLVPRDLSARVNPGIADTLAALEAVPGEYRNSLVTGNFEPIARMKLKAAGLGRYFEPGQGGFGSDSDSRPDLPPIARQRAGGEGGAPWPRARTVVIGDTPRDIACAHADNLRVIGIATGPFTADQLTNADAVAASASELVDLLRQLFAN